MHPNSFTNFDWFFSMLCYKRTKKS
jgi:hypothetical protein